MLPKAWKIHKSKIDRFDIFLLAKSKNFFGRHKSAPENKGGNQAASARQIPGQLSGFQEGYFSHAQFVGFFSFHEILNSFDCSIQWQGGAELTVFVARQLLLPEQSDLRKWFLSIGSWHDN